MFSFAKVRFVKIEILFTSLIPCLLPPREHRRNSDSTPQEQKVLFVNICHLHWLYSARGYPREFPSGHSGISGTAVPFGCLVLAVPPARILATASCLFILPNIYSGVFSLPSQVQFSAYMPSTRPPLTSKL